MLNATRCAVFAGAGVLLFFCSAAAQEKNSGEKIAWQSWSDDIFEKAKKENRFVLLDLGAGWCHWCHVMDEITYRDEEVVALVRKKYLAVRVDQDSRPDLSNRYEDYGWPATIVFNADGGEIVKRQGYIPPKPMARLLQAIIDDPTPGPSVVPEKELQPAGEAALGSAARKKLRGVLRATYDFKNRGWGDSHKFLDWDNVEFCLSQPGDAQCARMAKETLAAQRKLIDPVWGGAYQYSVGGDWNEPHFEKIMQIQAEDLRVYALAYALWRDPADLRSAEKIHEFLKNFLMAKDGAFYTSMDADLVPGEHAAEFFALDDAARRKKGIPRIDTHIYARENGWAIHALAVAYGATGDPLFLDEAVRAANWIVAHRAMEGGGFCHDEIDAAGPYLGDSLFMARAFLSLYSVTAERSWLRLADDAMRFAETKFKAGRGFVSSAQSAAPLKSKPQIDENIALARVANLLWQFTGKNEHRECAQHAMRFLASPGLAATRGYDIGGFLLADQELRAPALHITIVGKKDDADARALFLAALKLPRAYKRVEWWDAREGAMPNADVQYPQLDKAAAFVCTEGSCSAPVFSPEKLSTLAMRKMR